MTVVYLDSVFALNFLLDYLLFLAAARLSGISLRRGRYLLSGALGGLYAALVFLPGGRFLMRPAFKAAVGVLLSLVAFGRERHFLRLTLLTFGIACALAGSVLSLSLLAAHPIPSVGGIFYTNVDGKTLLITAAGIYLVLSLLFHAAASHALRGELLPTAVCLLGQTVHFTALRDTGNGLRDAAGDPVLTAERTCFPMLPPEVRLLSPTDALPCLRRDHPALRPLLLPCRTAAGSGLLLSIQCDWAEIDGVRHPGLRIALTESGLGDGYSALWGGERRTYHASMAAQTAFPAGTVPGTGDPLHRRQRHTAPAFEPGTGSGASLPRHGRGRKERTDRTQSASGGLHRPPL